MSGRRGTLAWFPWGWVHSASRVHLRWVNPGHHETSLLNKVARGRRELRRGQGSTQREGEGHIRTYMFTHIREATTHKYTHTDTYTYTYIRNTYLYIRDYTNVIHTYTYIVHAYVGTYTYVYIRTYVFVLEYTHTQHTTDVQTYTHRHCVPSSSLVFGAHWNACPWVSCALSSSSSPPPSLGRRAPD